MPKYNDDILNYYNDDSRVGSLDEKSDDVGTGLVGSPSCGDVMKLQIKVKKNKIVDAKILVFGCGSAKASSSYMAEQLVGKTLEEAMKIKNTDIANSLGLPKIKLHCSILAESAIKHAVEDYQKKNGTNGKKVSGNRNEKTRNNMKNTIKNGVKNKSGNIKNIDTNRANSENINNDTNGNISRHCNTKVNRNISNANSRDYIDTNNRKRLVDRKSNSERKNENNIIEEKKEEKKKNRKKISIEITDEAIAFTDNHLTKVDKDVKGVRLSLEEGHCGLMYKVRYVESAEDVSNYIEIVKKDLHIFIAKKDADILSGTIIEYKEDCLKRGLVFRNPRENGRCKCGKNFFINKQTDNRQSNDSKKPATKKTKKIKVVKTKTTKTKKGKK